MIVTPCCKVRQITLFMLSLNVLFINAQETGSLNVSRYAQAEFGVMPFGYAGETTIEQLKGLQTGDKNLNRDFSSYDKGYGTFYFNNFPGEWYAGVTYFRNLKTVRSVSWSAGIRYHQVYLGGLAYYTSETSARDTFFNSRGEGIVEYQVFSNQISFMVAAHEVLIPVSIYWSGRKERFIWVEPGIQLFPGVIFGARYQYFESFSITRTIARIGAKPERSYAPPDEFVYSHNNTPVSGTGFSLNAGFPVTLYMRASRTHRVLSRIQLMGNITPIFRFSCFPGMSTRRYTTTSASFGIRYRL